jgi:hypothetical protein
MERSEAERRVRAAITACGEEKWWSDELTVGDVVDWLDDHYCRPDLQAICTAAAAHCESCNGADLERCFGVLSDAVLRLTPDEWEPPDPDDGDDLEAPPAEDAAA